METLRSAAAALGFAALAATGSATGAAAQPFTSFGSEAGWNIEVNGRMGPGCLIWQTLADGSQIQMGIDATVPQRGYMALYTRQGTRLAPGETTDVSFTIDGRAFKGTAKGQAMEGYDGAFVWVNNRDFIYDLAKRNKLTVSAPGHAPLDISLAGTDAAFKALRTCQDAQKAQ